MVSVTQGIVRCYLIFLLLTPSLQKSIIGKRFYMHMHPIIDRGRFPVIFTLLPVDVIFCPFLIITLANY
jgi:hypothetical protein